MKVIHRCMCTGTPFNGLFHSDSKSNEHLRLAFLKRTRHARSGAGHSGQQSAADRPIQMATFGNNLNAIVASRLAAVNDNFDSSVLFEGS